VVWPGWLLNVPAGQEVHAELPVEELYDPGEQRVHVVAPASLDEPAEQFWHVVWPVWLLNVPAGQFPHSLLLFVELFVPKGQNVQLIAPWGL
jgi:hypothetical protein